VEYFEKHGERSYEVDIYRNLGEHYLEKRRYVGKKYRRIRSSLF